MKYLAQRINNIIMSINGERRAPENKPVSYGGPVRTKTGSATAVSMILETF